MCRRSSPVSTTGLKRTPSRSCQLPPKRTILPLMRRNSLLQTEVGYRRREALLRDLDSLTAIHRLRGGELRRRIERSDAVLVSNNYSLARAGKTFFDSLYGASGVPLCMLDSRAAAIAWLMSPVQAADLPRRQVIATSYAALSPPDAMWRKYLSEVRKLASRGDLSEDQVALLAFSPEARLALMNETDGDVGAFGEGTVPRVLQHARQTAQAETKEFPRGSISRIRFDCACSGSTRRLKARPRGGASRRSTAKMRSLSAKPDTCVTSTTKATTTRADARNGIARDQEG